METIQMHEPVVAAPKNNRTLYLAGALLLIAAAVAASFFFFQKVRANADYICTYIIEDAGECTNGSWSAWTTVSETPDANNCAITKVERRTYTGTRTTQQTLQYLNRRTACEAGYAQEQSGESGGESGFQQGQVFSQSVACQIQETRTTRAAGTGSNCGGSLTTSIGTDIGEVTSSSTQQLGTVDELTAFRVSMIDANIFARPSLVQQGGTTLIKWTSRETTACTVTGTNGDTWEGTGGEQTSGSITERTTYTLSCVAFNGSTATDQAIVDIVPVWEEE